MKVSPNFSKSEFACKGKDCCGGEAKLNYDLVSVLQRLRNHFSASVKITSAYRCSIHNKRVGGVWNSQHKLGNAADIQVSGVEPSVVQGYLLSTYPDSLGIGRYNTFTHVDVRPYKARWDNR